MQNSLTIEPREKTQTLKEISPIWAAKLERKQLPFPLSFTWFKWYFELDSPSKCVVGEAYGFSSVYEDECDECNRLGWSFGNSFLLRAQSRIEKDKELFVKHWYKIHARAISC